MVDEMTLRSDIQELWTRVLKTVHVYEDVDLLAYRIHENFVERFGTILGRSWRPDQVKAAISQLVRARHRVLSLRSSKSGWDRVVLSRLAWMTLWFTYLRWGKLISHIVQRVSETPFSVWGKF
jgi:hypothetical protein